MKGTLRAAAVVILVVGYGSCSSKPDGERGAGGGAGGSGAGNGGGGGAQEIAGEAQANAGARATKAGADGSGGQAGDSIAEGGSAQAGVAGSEGHAGAGPEHLTGLLGPVLDDQKPLIVSLGYTLNIADQPFLQTDAQGRVFTIGDYGVTRFVRYEVDRQSVSDFPLVNLYNVTIDTKSFSVRSDGTAYFAGVTETQLSGETYGGGKDAVIGKLNPQLNDVEWVHQLGASGDETGRLTLVTADGAVIAAGDSTGQLPGMPAARSGGHWLARYEADGTRTFLKQYDPLAASGAELFGQLLTGADDRLLMLGKSTTFLVNALDGTELSRSVGEALSLGGYLPAAMAPDGQTFFSWASVPGDPSGVKNLALSQRDLTGGLLGVASFEPPRSAVIDSQEDVSWNGSPDAVTTGSDSSLGLAVSDDSVFLVGTYRNEYKNGSLARPTTTPIFVGRYTLQGERVWFRELLINSDELKKATLLGIALDPSRNPVVGLRRPGSGFVGLVFTLGREDGALH
jgi:hypothetical protein